MESGIRRYQRIAPLFIILGLALVFLTALLLFLYRSPIDAYAQLLFIPVMFGAIYFGRKGGIIAAVSSGTIYVILLYLLAKPDVMALAFVKIGVYFVTYAIMGLAGGLLFERLREEIKEIEERVLLDRTTGLFTTRYFITSLQKELDRASRYKEEFSAAVFKFTEGMKELDKKSQKHLTRDVAAVFREQARIVDTVAICAPDEIGVVLPEVGKKGCERFIERVAEKLEPILSAIDKEYSKAMDITMYVFPAEEKAISELIERYAKDLEISYIKRPKEMK